MAFNFKNRRLPIIKFIVSGALIVFLIVLGIFQNNPNICEWWTRNISRGYQTFVGAIFKYLPFSFIEILILSAIGLLIFLIIRIIIDLTKKGFFKALDKLMIIAVSVLGLATTYVMTTSLAYYRAELPIELYEEKVDKTKFNSIVQYFLDDFNSCSQNLEYYESGEGY